MITKRDFTSRDSCFCEKYDTADTKRVPRVPLVLYFSQKTTAARNEVALSYHKVRGLYFLAVVFVRNIITSVLRMDRGPHYLG